MSKASKPMLAVFAAAVLVVVAAGSQGEAAIAAEAESGSWDPDRPATRELLGLTVDPPVRNSRSFGTPKNEGLRRVPQRRLPEVERS